MKRILTAALLCLLALLCGCAQKPEAEPPAQETVSVPAAPEPEPAPAEPEPEGAEPEPIPDGIVTINGRAFYYENGQPLTGSGPTERNGQLLYVQPDGSLFVFSTGVNRCGDTLYYHTGEDGCALLPPPAGLYDDGQALYDVQQDGSLLADGTDGYLTFGADGRYTGGSEELDAGIAQLLADSNPDLIEDRETRLSLVFDYIRDNFRYLSMPHYDAGTDDWAQEAAEVFLRQGKGNCYCFAAAFMYCARRLGYQAYVVAGHESTPDNDHAWTMIEENGETRLYDVQLEYAYLYQFGKGEIDAYAMTDSGGSVYNGFQYYFP